MESVIYIALFGLLITGAVVGAYNLLEGGQRNIAATGIQEEGTFLNRKINWALSSATDATVSGGGDTITIIRPDLGAESPLVVSGDGTTITITRDTGAAVQLNSDRYPVSNLEFEYSDIDGPGGRPPSVSVSFLVKDKAFNFRKYIR